MVPTPFVVHGGPACFPRSFDIAARLDAARAIFTDTRRVM
jgi:hypothetical protein